MNEGKLKIRQQLQRSFSVLKKCMQTFKESQTVTSSVKDKIGNFTEQYQCCAKVDISSLEICRRFPDLQERLLFKIECEANEIFAKLQSHVDVMKDCCDKITRQYDNSSKTYKRFSADLDLTSICEKTATQPSIADMLEWLQISESLFRQQYLCKQELMKMFRMSDESTTEMFMKEWDVGDNEMVKQIESYLCYTSFFLDEKI